MTLLSIAVVESRQSLGANLIQNVCQILPLLFNTRHPNLSLRRLSTVRLSIGDKWINAADWGYRHPHPM